MPNSLWVATTARPEPFPLLQGESRADVCIVGGGFMGLSTALTLAGKGVSVAVLEAAEIGWGASGRNNGLVAPGLKRDPWEVRKILGTESGDRLLRFAGDAPDQVFKLIDEHAIDCDLNRGGWIQAAHSKRALPLLERRIAACQALGAAVESIPAETVSADTGAAVPLTRWPTFSAWRAQPGWPGLPFTSNHPLWIFGVKAASGSSLLCTVVCGASSLFAVRTPTTTILASFAER